jgi:hypothetical protein
MEFKGTKGEWKIGNSELSVIEPNKGLIIAYVGSRNELSIEEQKSNAKIIAAAPELLEALQIYLNAGCKNQRRDASVIAKKAINKALL